MITPQNLKNKIHFSFEITLVTSKKVGDFFKFFWASQNIGTLVQPNILFSILSFYTVLFPSLLCRAPLLCTKSQFETGDCTHFDLFQLYSQVCIFPSRNRTVRVCEAVHALAHVRTPEAHQPSKHAV